VRRKESGFGEDDGYDAERVGCQRCSASSIAASTVDGIKEEEFRVPMRGAPSASRMARETTQAVSSHR
jgi:hypothetical protein